VRRGLLWLALVDLSQAWLRPGLAALAIALAILAVTFFASQIELRRAEVLAGYEAAGAATFVVQLSGVGDDEIDRLTGSVRALDHVTSAEAPYSGLGAEIVADTSFLVFRNEQQQEYLGARTSVLGVDANFDLARDYYVNLHDANPRAPGIILGMPLLVVAGDAQAPGPQEVLAASGVTDYVGVQPGGEATVELVYTGGGQPIVRRFDGLRLVGTFDLAGPDQGRFDPFWRFNARGRDVLTVRPEGTPTGPTSLPIIVNQKVFRDFRSSIRDELASRNVAAPLLPERHQLVVRASSIGEVPVTEAAVERTLGQSGLDHGCDSSSSRSFCVRLPERNNFRAALQEQMKVGSGGAFFITLLLALVAIGTAGLQVQTIVARWREYGVLQALGFTPGQIFVHYGLQLGLILTGGIAIAALTSPLLPSWSATSFIVAAALAAIATVFATAPVLAWPLWRSPAELLRVAA
jgi:hypothetical protein